MRTDETSEDDSSDRALDELLKQARFPESRVDAQARLRTQWVALSRKRQMTRIVSGVGAAAVVVLISGIALMTMRSDVRQEHPLVGPKMLVTQAPNWRQPTLSERFVALQPDKRTRRTPDPKNTQAHDPSIDRLLRQLNDPLVDRRLQAARELSKVGRPQVVQTLSKMVQCDVNRREALAALMLSDDPEARRAIDAAKRSSNVVSAQVFALKQELHKDF